MRRIVTVTPAASLALVDLETVKDELGVADTDDSQDTRLTRYIAEASAIIAGVCQREFQVERIVEKLYLDRGECPATIYLSRKPLVGIVTAMTVDPATAGTTVLPIDAVEGISVGMPVSGPAIVPGTVVASVDEGFTISLPIAADIPSGADVTFGISVSRTSDATLVSGVDYQLDAANGALLRAPIGCFRHWGFGFPGTITVAYSAGYDPIPPEVAGACIQVVAMLNGRHGRDPLVRSVATEGLDSVTYRDLGPSEDDLRSFVAARLARYMPPPAFA